MNDFPATCDWCDEGATERLGIGKRGARTVYAHACREHAAKLLPEAAAIETPAVEERTEPLCDSCHAEITYVRLSKDGRLTGRRMPVERKPLRAGVEIKRSMVVVNPRKGTAVVLTDALVSSGEAQRWVAAGAQLHLSHFVSCSAAKEHRRQQAAGKAA